MSTRYDHRRADGDALVQVGDISIQHADAAIGHKAAEANVQPAAKEFQGPKGPEPTRYGDWENKGIASDF